MQQRDQQENRPNEQELADFHADVEQQQTQGDVVFRKTDLRK